MSSRNAAIWLLGVVALVSSNCTCSSGSETSREAPRSDSEGSGGATPSSGEAAREGWYRAVLVSARGDEVPFFVRLPRGGGRALVDGGDHSIEPKHRWKGSRVEVEFPMVQTSLTATEEKDGTLEGRWRIQALGWGEAELTFRAAPVPRPDPAIRFSWGDGAPARSEAAGIWKLDFEDSGRGKLWIRGEGDELRATLQFLSGNVASLHGSVHGDQLKLSAFDGSSPYLIVAELSADGITGTWTAGPKLGWRESFEGKRGEDFAFEPEIRVAEGASRLKLEALDAPRYRDKPVLLQLSSSWCPACSYAGDVLVDLYERYHPRGLEILTLSYEFTEDEAYNRRQAEAFKRKYGVKWEVLPVHGGIEKASKILPGELDRVNPGGFPIAVFLARDRQILGVHAGFPPPGAREIHEATIEKYETMIGQLLAE